MRLHLISNCITNCIMQMNVFGISSIRLLETLDKIVLFSHMFHFFLVKLQFLGRICIGF